MRIMIKIAMLAAMVGHILCGVSDCLLSYSKSGRLNLGNIAGAIMYLGLLILI